VERELLLRDKIFQCSTRERIEMMHSTICRVIPAKERGMFMDLLDEQYAQILREEQFQFDDV